MKLTKTMLKTPVYSPSNTASLELPPYKQNKHNTIFEFSLNPGLECIQIHRFNQQRPSRSFSSFVQPPLNAPRHSDENPHSSVVTKTLKLRANSSCGYRMTNTRRHTTSNYLNDENDYTAKNSKL